LLLCALALLLLLQLLHLTAGPLYGVLFRGWLLRLLLGPLRGRLLLLGLLLLL
jgi:hypothetical protein